MIDSQGVADVARKTAQLIRHAMREEWDHANDVANEVDQQYGHLGMYAMCRGMARIALEHFGETGVQPGPDGEPFMHFQIVGEDDQPIDPDAERDPESRSMTAACRFVCAEHNKDTEQLRALFRAAYEDDGEAGTDLVTGLVMLTTAALRYTQPEQDAGAPERPLP